MDVTQKITKLLEAKFQEEEFDDCFIVEVQQNNSKLEVFVDSDSSMTFKKCQRLSRYLEHHIDEQGWMGEKYTLEVSSPGTERPLAFKRQYTKNIGRKLEVSLEDDVKTNGLLTEVKDNHIYLEEKVRVKEGKRKVSKVLTHEIAFADIKKAVVKISFK